MLIQHNLHFHYFSVNNVFKSSSMWISCCNLFHSLQQTIGVPVFNDQSHICATSIVKTNSLNFMGKLDCRIIVHKKSFLQCSHVIGFVGSHVQLSEIPWIMKIYVYNCIFLHKHIFQDINR